MKNKSAQSMAHLRWSKTTPEERKAYSVMLHNAKANKKRTIHTKVTFAAKPKNPEKWVGIQGK